MTFRCAGGVPGRDAADHTVWRGGGVSTARSAATGMGGARKAARTKTAGIRTMAAARAGRAEEEPQARTIRQTSLPLWPPCAGAGAFSAFSWCPGVSWGGVDSYAATPRSEGAPMSQPNATNCDHVRAAKAREAVGRCIREISIGAGRPSNPHPTRPAGSIAQGVREAATPARRPGGSAPGLPPQPTRPVGLSRFVLRISRQRLRCGQDSEDGSGGGRSEPADDRNQRTISHGWTARPDSA